MPPSLMVMVTVRLVPGAHDNLTDIMTIVILAPSLMTSLDHPLRVMAQVLTRLECGARVRAQCGRLLLMKEKDVMKIAEDRLRFVYKSLN